MLAMVLTALSWALAGALALAGLALVAALAVPVTVAARLEASVHLDLDGSATGGMRWQAALDWGWGLIRLRARGRDGPWPQVAVTVAGLRIPTRWGTGRRRRGPGGSGRQPGVLRQRPGRPGRRPRRARQLRRPVWRRRFRLRLPDLDLALALLRAGIRLAGRLWRAWGWQVRGDLTFGFPDPAATGLCLAALAVAPVPAGVAWRADWLDPGLRGWLAVRGRLYGFQVLAAAAAVLWSPDIRRRWWQTLRKTMGGMFRWYWLPRSSRR